AEISHGPVGFAGLPVVPSLRPAPTAVALRGSIGLTEDCAGCTGGTGTNGPGNYDDIVAAKLLIARSLKNDVVPILEAVGPTGGYYFETARETLYQQMLVRLADAYNVNAIVQYPVDVESPWVTPSA